MDSVKPKKQALVAIDGVAYHTECIRSMCYGKVMGGNRVRCPLCGYERQPEDRILPDWQCPKCRGKYPNLPKSEAPDPDGVVGELSQRAPGIHRVLRIAIGLVAVAMFCSYWFKGAKISPSAILSELYQEPKQTKTEREEFRIQYQQRSYVVRPVARYELWGLVVSHNNIKAFSDIYHDSNSLDTKDLCVIWGRNVKTKDFHKVSFKSGAFTCYFRYGGGVRFDKRRLSNNHLITDSDDIRRQIANVRIGDQVHLQGLLVDYRYAKSRTRWRRTSRTRLDTENGACEVMFVERIKVLVRGTPLWYFLYTLSKWLLVVLLLAKFALTLVEAYAPRFNASG